MGILPRHVVLEVVKVFSVTLAVATLLLVVVGVVRTAYDYGLGLAQTIPLLPYVVPDALRFAVPGALLLAVCNVYGRLSAGNELIAIQSLGIHLGRVIWPTIALAASISLGTVFLNDDAVCWGHDQIEKQAVANAADIVYGILRTQRSFGNEKLSIHVASVEGRRLIAPLISLPPSSSMPACVITAEEAELRADPAAGDLLIICRNGSVDAQGKWSVRFPDTFEQRVPLEAARTKTRSMAPAWIRLRDIPATADQRRKHLEEHENRMAARAAFEMTLGDFDALTDRQWLVEHEVLRDEQSYLHRLATEPPRRWASGFSCLCFALVGVPLAIRFRTSDFLTTFFLCFLPILLVYYPLLAYGIDAAKRGALRPEVVWTGNTVVGLCGLWLIWRQFRR